MLPWIAGQAEILLSQKLLLIQLFINLLNYPNYHMDIVDFKGCYFWGGFLDYITIVIGKK